MLQLNMGIIYDELLITLKEITNISTLCSYDDIIESQIVV